MSAASGYAVKQEHIAIAGVAGLHIRSLLDRQQFADPLGAALALGISSAAWPLFGLLWPSGLQLAARMALRPVCGGERVLEIGCGLGLASLVSHRRGVDITASDCHPLAAAFLRENLRLNDLPPMPYLHGQWAADDSDEPLAGQPLFDLVIGSDLLYERDDSGAMARFIARHTAPGGEVWIVDPDRGNRPAFHRHMAGFGFAVTQERLSAAAGDPVYKGRLLHYRRPLLPG